MKVNPHMTCGLMVDAVAATVSTTTRETSKETT
jgi:hypothetical protein